MSERRNRGGAALGVRIVLVLALVLAAAGGGYVLLQESAVDAEASLARARTAFEAGDVNAAVIDLKSVLSAEPGNREARFLLGRIYVEGGNPQGAMKELTRARELGENSEELNLALTRAMLLSGRFDEAATEIAIHGDTDELPWLVLRGMLDLAQQRIDDARAAFKAVLEVEPEHQRARRGLMQAELAAGNAALARQEVEALLEAGHDEADLWLIKGDLDLYDGKPEQARESFAKALEVAPKNPLALMGMARALIALDDIDAAARQLDAIGDDGSEDPRVNFLRARIADARGDARATLQALRKVLQIAPMHRESLTMAAKTHFGQGEFTAAQDYVTRLLEIEPQNAAARRMLGAIQLAAGRLDGLDEMSNALGDDAAAQDPGMLALLGTTYLKYGRLDDSQASLERAAELAPDSLPIRTQLALSRLSAGKPQEAIAELEAIRAADPAFAQAGIMLALAHLSQGDTQAAIEVAADLVESNPQSALAHNVSGYVHEVAGEQDAARTAFEHALELDAGFHPARINLARLAIRAGDVEAGRQHFQRVLDIEPYHAFALMGLAALALQRDEIDEAERLWLLAREHNADAVAPRLLLAKHYRARNNQPLAERLIKEAYRLAPYALQVQAEYAEIMLQGGHHQEALQAARALSARVPDSLPALELLARVYNQLGDEDGLTETLEKVTGVAPDAIGARVLLGRLAIRRDDFDQARDIAAALLEAEESKAAGYELRGDVLLAADEPEAAREAYLQAHETQPSTANLLKLDQVERRLDRGGVRLDEWLAAHPDDLQARFARASYMQQEGSGSAAIPEYERMLSKQGDNPVLLNNLAWLYHEAGDERAVELARRAYELAPAQPEIMDTYGWILFNAGQHEQGLDVLQKAAGAAPDNPDIVYHAIHARYDSGAKRAAREQLEALLEKHARFPLREEAEALLARMEP